MAKGSLRRFDVQAKYALVISMSATLGVLALLVLIFRNFRIAEVAVVYGGKSMFAPAVFVVTALTLLVAATGAMLGFNSAGQKRNPFNKRSWTAFFVGTATASATIILFGVFWFCRLAI